MKKKKIAVSLLISTAFLTSSTAAFAANAYPVCSYADCYLTAAHTHNGCTYSGHFAGDGHTSHQVCSFTDCTQTEPHAHDGCLYNGHTTSGGHSHHSGSSGHGHGKNRHH